MLDDIKKTLWATAGKLRANMDAAEYKHLVLGLIFVKYISDTLEAWRGSPSAPRADTSTILPELVGGQSIYQDIPGFCRSVKLAEIAEHGQVLTPGRYVGAEAFADKMQKLTEKLGEQMAKDAELDQLAGLGYEI